MLIFFVCYSLGPAGVARMRYPISDKTRDEVMPGFIKKKRSKPLGNDDKNNNKRNTETSKTAPVVPPMEVAHAGDVPDNISDDYDMAGVGYGASSGELSDVEDIEDLPTIGEKV